MTAGVDDQIIALDDDRAGAAAAGVVAGLQERQTILAEQLLQIGFDRAAPADRENHAVIAGVFAHYDAAGRGHFVNAVGVEGGDAPRRYHGLHAYLIGLQAGDGAAQLGLRGPADQREQQRADGAR